MIRGVTGDPPPEPRVLGVNDWAWRKGSRCGTLLCDLERGRIIDLLPDRPAETLAAWLRCHRSVTIVVRDRAGAYADGARQGAPEATQVADRWHLLRNCGDALRELLDHHHRQLREAAQATAGAGATEAPAGGDGASHALRDPDLTTAQRRSLDRLQRRDARFAEAVRLREHGLSISTVARTLGVERTTIRRWLRAGHAPTWRHATPSRSLLDPFREHLEARWAAGYRNGTGLWREIRAHGFIGQASIVRQWAARRRRQDPPVDGATAVPASPTKAAQPPTPRRTARLLMTARDQLAYGDRRFVEALLDPCPPIAHAVALAAAFSTMIKERLADTLDDWIKAAEGSGLNGFAASLRRDRSAVHAALTLPWSTGPVEGHINRVKVIKREMCGRAGFELLRSRV